MGNPQFLILYTLIPTIILILPLLGAERKKTRWYPRLGVLLEQAGVVAQHTGFIHIPYTFHTPTPELDSQRFDNCTGKVAIIRALHEMKQHVRGMIPDDLKNGGVTLQSGRKSPDEDFSLHPRQKRFAFIGAAVAAVVGGAIWNRISIHDLQTSVNDVVSHVNNNAVQISRLTEAMIESRDNLKSVVHSLSAASRWGSLLQEHISCDEHQDDWIHSMIMNYAVFGPRDFLDGYLSALSGHISPTILPHRLLSKMIRDIPELGESIYRFYPSLIYEIGGIALGTVTSDPFVLGGVLYLPRIKVGDLHEYYYTYVLPSVHQGYVSRLYLPARFIFSVAENKAYEFTNDDCVSIFSLMVCPSYRPKSNINECITRLISANDSSSCTREVTAVWNGPKVLTTRSSILVSEQVKNVSLVQVLPDRELRTQTLYIGQNTRLTPAMGDYVICDSAHYSLLNVQEEYDEQVVLTEVDSHQGVDIGKLQIPVTRWGKEEELRPWSFSYTHNVASHMWVIPTGLGIILVILIIRFRRKIQSPRAAYHKGGTSVTGAVREDKPTPRNLPLLVGVPRTVQHMPRLSEERSHETCEIVFANDLR